MQSRNLRNLKIMLRILKIQNLCFNLYLSISEQSQDCPICFGCSVVFGLFSAPSLVLLSCWFGSHGLRVTPSGITTTEAEEAVASYRNATIFACKKPL